MPVAVVASHYAEPLVRHLSTPAALLPDPDIASVPVAMLALGDELRILDISRGWAWGYGPDGRVGYVKSDALVP